MSNISSKIRMSILNCIEYSVILTVIVYTIYFFISIWYIFKGHYVAGLIEAVFSLFFVKYWYLVMTGYLKLGCCPLYIVERHGFRSFFRASRLSYKKEYHKAMWLYLPYIPLFIFYMWVVIHF